jgi:cytochrome c55X
MPQRAGTVATGAAMLLALAATASAGEISSQRAGQLNYLVLEDCGSCHGMTLKGGLGKPLRPADLEDLEIETIATVILEGVPGTPMPAWRGLLTEDEAAWIAAALKLGLIK